VEVSDAVIIFPHPWPVVSFPTIFCKHVVLPSDGTDGMVRKRKKKIRKEELQIEIHQTRVMQVHNLF
jgi:hypothetical protein